VQIEAPPRASGGVAVAGAEPRARHGLRAIDLLTLSLIVLVVALVSLPRLFDFARRENEEDAVWLVRAALEELGSIGAETRTASARPATLGELFARSPRLARQFRDRRLLEGGRLVHHHGYLFELVTEAGGERVLGWPTHHGRTGVAALFGVDRGGEPVLLGSSRAAEHGRPRPPRLDPAELAAHGWMELAAR
jgi:hypothetical protein